MAGTLSKMSLYFCINTLHHIEKEAIFIFITLKTWDQLFLYLGNYNLVYQSMLKASSPPRNKFNISEYGRKEENLCVCVCESNYLSNASWYLLGHCFVWRFHFYENISWWWFSITMMNVEHWLNQGWSTSPHRSTT